jgi:hypothetical protein
MTNAEWIKKIMKMNTEELLAEIMSVPEFLTDSYYSQLGNAIRTRYKQLQNHEYVKE